VETSASFEARSAPRSYPTGETMRRREFIAMARNYLCRRYTEARIRLAAGRLVRNQRQQIEVASRALMRRGTLNGDEISAVLAGTRTSAVWVQ
jgi:hypothetical protein